MAPAATAKYDWILAITTIAFCFSAFGNGANDVANSYATSVAARTLTMPQVGFLAAITEFIGAVALGSRVTSTIKNGIFKISRFDGRPGALMLAMSCAEVGSASWLMLATRLGFPVSTTQTVVGALIGVGFASQAGLKWAWQSGSISQIAASWAIAPLLAGAFSAIIFGTLKYGVLERQDSLKAAMQLIPFYLAFTAAILALFIVVEAPTAPSLEEFGTGKVVGIVLGVFFGVLLIAYIFFMPYFKRRIIREDSRIRFYHIPLGPLLLRENPPLYFPGKGTEYVKDYYEDSYGEAHDAGKNGHSVQNTSQYSGSPTPDDAHKTVDMPPADPEKFSAGPTTGLRRRGKPGPHERFLAPVKNLSWASPAKWWGYFKFVVLQGVTRDCVSHDSALLQAVHSKARKYDVRVEHLWTYCQVRILSHLSSLDLTRSRLPPPL